MILSWSGNNDHEPHDVAGYSRAGLTSLPASVLDRHGARMLQPSEVWQLPGYEVVGPTAYRSSILLIPYDLLQSRESRAVGPRGDDGDSESPCGDPVVDINTVLADVGMTIDRPPVRTVDLPAYIPVPVVLKPMAGKPAIIDAWRALQALRAGEAKLGFSARRITLDHLVIGSASSGVGLGVIEGVPGMGNGTSTGPVADTYNSDYLLRPVAVPMHLPPRQQTASLTAGRRAVVAVLDTGLAVNHHLGITRLGHDPQRWRLGDFVQLDEDAQAAVLDAEQRGGVPELIEDARDRPSTAQPLIGEIDTHTGHQTFICGICRQAAPDSTVLVTRILRSDGIGYQSAALAALGALLRRVQTAQGNSEPEKMVDVVSLSWGYFPEIADSVPPGTGNQDQTLALTQVINDLRECGVVVVAAAGNFATDRPFLPAGLADQPQSPTDPVGVISVGALNPNGSKAIYSDDGCWVRCWATGSAVVSTFPQHINAARNPSIGVRTHNGHGLRQWREAADGDDYRAGFAVWTGTSFAAPYVAAWIANALQSVDLTDISPAATRARAEDVVRRVPGYPAPSAGVAPTVLHSFWSRLSSLLRQR